MLWLSLIMAVNLIIAHEENIPIHTAAKLYTRKIYRFFFYISISPYKILEFTSCTFGLCLSLVVMLNNYGPGQEYFDTQTAAMLENM